MKREKLKLFLFKLRKLLERSTSIDYLENYNTSETKIIDMLDKYVYILKCSSDERFNYKYDLYESKTIGDEEWDKNKELRIRYKLFGTILGITDGGINEKINNNSAFINIKEIIRYREYVIKVYNDTKIDDSIEDIDIIIMNYPSKRKHIDNYLKLQSKYSDFNKAYLYGFNEAKNIDFNKFISVFTNTLQTLINYENLNKEYVKTKTER